LSVLGQEVPTLAVFEYDVRKELVDVAELVGKCGDALTKCADLLLDAFEVPPLRSPSGAEQSNSLGPVVHVDGQERDQRATGVRATMTSAKPMAMRVPSLVTGRVCGSRRRPGQCE